MNSATYDSGSPRLNFDSLKSVQNEDVLAKLRYSEEQLQQERRARGWMEAEIQSGKTQLASITAKVEKLSETVVQDSTIIRDLNRLLHDTDQRAKDTTQQLLLKVEKDNVRLQQMLADVTAKQRFEDNGRQEQDERQRMISEELNHLRYKLEAYTLKTQEVGHEVSARSRDLEVELQRGADTFRTLKDHEHTLGSLHTLINTQTDQMQKKIDLMNHEMRQRLEAEARSRGQFEQNIRDLTHDIRRALQTQDKDQVDRIEGLKSAISQQAERERSERDRLSSTMLDQCRALEGSLKNSQAQISDKVQGQINSVDILANENRNAQKQFETVMRADLEDGLKLLNQIINKKSEEASQNLVDFKNASLSNSKALQDAILLVERTSDQKISAFEDVMRAEIKSRMETDLKVTSLTVECYTRIESSEKAVLSRMDELLSDSVAIQAKLREELKRVTDQLSATQKRSTEDLEAQILQNSQRLKQSDTELASKHQLAMASIDAVKREQMDALVAAENRLSVAISSAQTFDENTAKKIAEVELLCSNVKNDVEEKLNMKTVQLDQTMEVFKAELTARVTLSEAEETKKELEQLVVTLHTKTEALATQVSDAVDSIEDHSTRTEVDELELRFKSLVSSMQSKMNVIDEAVILNSAQLLDRSSKTELHEAERKIKDLIAELKQREQGAEDALSALKDEISHRVVKANLIETEEKLKAHINGLEEKLNECSESMSLIKESVSVKADKEDLETATQNLAAVVEENEKAIDSIQRDMVTNKESLLESSKALVEEAKSDLEEHIVALKAKQEKIVLTLETTMSVIKESSDNYDEKIEEVKRLNKSAIESQNTIIDKVKDMTIENYEELSKKMDGIPEKISDIRQQQQNLRSWMIDTSQIEGESTAKALMEIKTELEAKASETKLTHGLADVSTALQKLNAQYEIESMEINQTKQKISEYETSIKEKLREMNLSTERALKEQTQSVVQNREQMKKRLEDLENKQAQMPRIFDATNLEIKRLKNDIDDRVNGEIRKVEKELMNIKGALQSCPTDKELNETVLDSIRPLSVRVDRLMFDVDDLRAAVASERAEASRRAEPSVTPGTFYKPPQMNYKQALDDEQPKSRIGSAPRRQTPEIDPRLEKLADLANEY